MKCEDIIDKITISKEISQDRYIQIPNENVSKISHLIPVL